MFDRVLNTPLPFSDTDSNVQFILHLKVSLQRLDMNLLFWAYTGTVFLSLFWFQVGVQNLTATVSCFQVFLNVWYLEHKCYLIRNKNLLNAVFTFTIFCQIKRFKYQIHSTCTYSFDYPQLGKHWLGLLNYKQLS